MAPDSPSISPIPSPAPSTQKASPSAVALRQKLLIVEDDPVTYRALKTILQARGWDVDVASTLREAFDALAAKPEVLILDLMLPDGNGTLLLSAIRRDKLPIHVIITTGASDPQYLSPLGHLRPEAILFKPVDLPQLLLHLPPTPNP